MIKVCYIWHKSFKSVLPYWATPEKKQGLEGILFWNTPLEIFRFVTLWQDLSFLDLIPLGNSSRRNQDPYKFCKFFLNTPGNYTTFLINLTHRISTCSFSNTPLQKKTSCPHSPLISLFGFFLEPIIIAVLYVFFYNGGWYRYLVVLCYSKSNNVGR